MRGAGVVCIAFALVAVLARGWGLAGLDGYPGIAPPLTYRLAAIFALPLGLILFVIGLTLIIEGGRRARDGRDECS